MDLLLEHQRQNVPTIGNLGRLSEKHLQRIFHRIDKTYKPLVGYGMLPFETKGKVENMVLYGITISLFKYID